MESDTGAAVTIVSEKHFREDFDNSPLRKSELLLTTYSEYQLTVLDTTDGVVQYERQRCELPLTVVRRDCMASTITLSWRKINAVSKHAERSVEYLVDKYRELQDELHRHH